MRTDDFDFELPEALIALRPPESRDGARLLHVAGARLDNRRVIDLPGLLAPGDALVFNDSRVIPAQLAGQRPPRPHGGGSAVAVDVTLHKRASAPLDGGENIWLAFVRPAKRIAAGDIIDFGDGFAATVVSRDGAEARIAFNCSGAEFREALARAGAPPLPPYIARKRPLSADDAVRYQTIYARREGSVAAPTAGLHFTDDLFAALDARGVERIMTTLHVGAGTFLPVSADDPRQHVMHSEWGEISREAAHAVNAVRKRGGRVVAVGTTSLRLLETAADDAGTVRAFRGETDIFITPGYRFRAVDALFTNFHLPRSTLFMLVCALAGLERMQAAYAHAIDRGYRFYSYGDACLIERAP